MPGYEVRLVDDDGARSSADGEIGELLVRGPTSAVMYWNKREQSRATFLGDWTRTGDKYIEDEDGYFVYCGRRDDMLKVCGICVSPFEVEGALQSHPDGARSRRGRLADTDGLIKPKAFVVLQSAGKGRRRPARRRCRNTARQKLARRANIRAGSSSARAAEDRDRQDPALQAAGWGE